VSPSPRSLLAASDPRRLPRSAARCLVPPVEAPTRLTDARARRGGGSRSVSGRGLPRHWRRHGRAPVAASLRCRSVIRTQHLFWGGEHRRADPAGSGCRRPLGFQVSPHTCIRRRRRRRNKKRKEVVSRLCINTEPPGVPANPCRRRQPTGGHASVTKLRVAAGLLDSTPPTPDRRSPLLF